MRALAALYQRTAAGMARQLALMVLLVVLSAVGSRGVMAADFQPWRADSRSTLEQQFARKPFILALWSLDCAYCAEELRMLGAWVKQHPQVALVTVNTDIGQATDAATFMDALALPAHARWQFAGNDADRLRYQLDPAWYGELPRTYFYDTRHQVQAISGRPAKDWLDNWGRSLP
jgi:thiol-disulfide isomerase/thioredoxin